MVLRIYIYLFYKYLTIESGQNHCTETCTLCFYLIFFIYRNCHIYIWPTTATALDNIAGYK